MSNDDVDRDLEALLRRIEPATSADQDVRSEIAAMAEAVAAGRRSPRRSPATVVVALTASLLAVGTAGAAYAATAIDWSRFWYTGESWAGWAESPDATLTYDLPGGGSCEMRIGDVVFSPSDDLPAGVETDGRAAEAVRDFLRSTDLAAVIDVDAAIRELRASDLRAIDEDGAEAPFGFGTTQYNADAEYTLAVRDAVFAAVTEHLRAVDLPVAGVGFQSQERCEGQQR